MILRPRPITKEAFAEFGELVEAGPGGQAANQGTARRIDFTAELASLRPHAKANLALFCTGPQPRPLRLRLVERHPHSSQLFSLLEGSRFLVVVAPSGPDGEPVWERLSAFVCGRGQAVNYRPGLWHHPIFALDGDATLLMLSWEDGTAGDCEERALPEPSTVEI